MGLLEKQDGVQMHVRTLKRKLEDLGLKRKAANHDDCTGAHQARDARSWLTGRISLYWHALRLRRHVNVPRSQVASIMKEINPQGVQERMSRRLKRAKVINPDAPMPLPVALGLLPLSSFFSLHRHNLHPRSRCALEDSRICGNIWLQADSFAHMKSRTFSNSKPEIIWLP